VIKSAIILGLIILLPPLAQADIIFFKDGMKTVCQEKAWEEGQEVKCEYEGTVLSYQKKDVLRIQQIRTEKKVPPAEPVKMPEQPAAAKVPPAEPVKTPEQPAAAVATPSSDGKAPDSKPKPREKKDLKASPIQPTGVSGTKGLEFYNPRRPQKYWTSAVSKHQTFEQAIAALAKQYDRSPDWIQQQMGETNDLDEIHRNLARSKLSVPVETTAQTEKKVSNTLFYNPRRPHKYWTSASAKHKTFKEAVNALSAEYDRPQQWVQQYMGMSNNLDEIHQNLRNQKLSESSP
jgi:hypothetical protein